MRQEILKYLGYGEDAVIDEHTDSLIDKALQELDELAEFQYCYGRYDEPQPFMLAHPAYTDYLHGADGYLLCATTLGIAVDRRLKRLQIEDMAYAVVYDAAAGVFLEVKADAYERELPFENLGFRFCPGYQNTPLDDNRQIASLLKAHKIGITFLDSGLMIPMKSMTGIVRIGGEARKSCVGCVARESCVWRKRGETCYHEETKKNNERR